MLERPSTTTAVAVAVATTPKLTRRRSRNVTYTSPPPPLPLISLPPDDKWDEFDTPTRTGFDYSLPHIELACEEFEDLSAQSSASAAPDHERPKICRLLSDYMTQNETFQTQRHGFGVDTRLVYKRCKDSTTAAAAAAVGVASSAEDLNFDAFFESGNLDRAYRIIGRHYASSHELLSAATLGTSSGSSQPPFAFFVKTDMEYDLYCDTDMNTHGHVQWYFFRAVLSTAATAIWRQRSNINSSSSSASVKVRFNIRNMLKRASLYNDGMLPTVHIDGPSACRRGWHHAGANVCYFKNADTYRNRKTGKVQNYYTLSFVYEFDIAAAVGGNDAPQQQQQRLAGGSAASLPPMAVYFAHCYPYTYTRLQRFLLTLQKDSDRSRFVKRRVLCKSIAGNNCDLLTITDFSQEDSSDQPYATKRTGVFLTARVHPGESNSSFVMHGILELLTGSSLEARYLRHNFVFKIVPMLNPDGVVHGNYRCSLAGTDLNRRWAVPSMKLHPTILATKNAILSMKTTRPVSLYVDIHGHSRKKNMFLYGCRPFDTASRTEATRVRLFPYLLSKTSTAQRGGFFSFPDCTFSVSGAKKGTGRVVVWKEAQVIHSFTLEASFFGVGTNKKQQFGPLAGSSGAGAGGSSRTTLAVFKHFTPLDLRMAGTKFCHALVPFAQVINLDRTAAQAQHAVYLRTEVSLRAAAAQAKAVVSTSSSACEYEPTLNTLSTLPASASSPRASDNKLRLAPLAAVLGCSTARTDTDELLRVQPLTARPPPTPAERRSPTLQFLPQTSDTLVLVAATAADAVSGSADPATPLSLSYLPSGFDEPFADDSMTALLALSDPKDLLKEIEAALPDGLADDDVSEDGSVGSESDPSDDNMEEEELQSVNIWKTLVSTATALGPTLKLPHTRSLHIVQHLSESRLHQRSANQRKAPEPVTTPACVEPKPEPPSQRSSVTTAPLAPLRMTTKVPLQRIASLQSAPSDRNRDIASLHLRAVQRRSKSRRELQQPIHEALE